MRTFILLFGCLLSLLFGGCASQGSVDYTTLVQSTCKLATAEVTFLQTQSTLPTADVAAVQKIASVVTPACSAVSTNPQDTYGILATVMISLTSLYLTYHTGAAQPATGPVPVPTL